MLLCILNRITGVATNRDTKYKYDDGVNISSKITLIYLMIDVRQTRDIRHDRGNNNNRRRVIKYSLTLIITHYKKGNGQ